MMPKNRKSASRAERKARRPREILEAAFEEFTAKGYAATRVEDVASRLDVTKGTIYLYFPTKDALFEAVMRHISAPFTELRASIANMEGSYTERLRILLTLAHEKVANDRAVREPLRLALAEGARFPHIVDRHYDEFIGPLIAAVGTLVEQGVACGEFRDTAATNTPDVIVSSVLHSTVWRLLFTDRRPFDEVAFTEAHIDLVLKGLLQQR